MCLTQILKKVQAVGSIVELEMLWTNQRQAIQRNGATYVVARVIVTRDVLQTLYKLPLKLGLRGIPLMEHHPPSNLPRRVVHALGGQCHQALGTIEVCVCLFTTLCCIEFM